MVLHLARARARSDGSSFCSRLQTSSAAAIGPPRPCAISNVRKIVLVTGRIFGAARFVQIRRSGLYR